MLTFEQTLKKLTDIRPNLFEFVQSPANKNVYFFKLNSKPNSNHVIRLIDFKYFPTAAYETIQELNDIFTELDRYLIDSQYESSEGIRYQVTAYKVGEKHPGNNCQMTEGYDIIENYKRLLTKIVEDL